MSESRGPRIVEPFICPICGHRQDGELRSSLAGKCVKCHKTSTPRAVIDSGVLAELSIEELDELAFAGKIGVVTIYRTRREVSGEQERAEADAADQETD